MYELDSCVQVQTSFLKSILDWSRADLVGFTAVKSETELLHQALFRNAERKMVFSSTRRASTCCELVLKNSDILSITENSKQRSKASCPMMAEQGFECYLGVPIFRNGLSIGALELMGVRPRSWSRREIGKFQEFSNVINVLLESG